MHFCLPFSPLTAFLVIMSRDVAEDGGPKHMIHRKKESRWWKKETLIDLLTIEKWLQAGYYNEIHQQREIQNETQES